MKVINQGIGMWRIVAVAGPILISSVCAVGFYIISIHLGSLTKEINVNEQQQREISTLQSSVNSLQIEAGRNSKIIDYLMGMDKK